MIDFKNLQRPQRYIGNEWNVIKKSQSGKISFCLCYPDLYELGMSNLGIHIIYGLLNQYSDCVCERVFMPGDDLATSLREKKSFLFSLETKTALRDFEILGFHLGCELNFTNVLHILELGGIALKSAQRKKTIVIGGGVANPEPLAEFIDVFYLGEFEEVADAFVSVLRRHKDKPSRLRALAQLAGFYVPQFYQAAYVKDQYIFTPKLSGVQFPLTRVYVMDLDHAFFPFSWLTSHTQLIHDRIPIEIARGCPHYCRFCQAQAIYAPYRERKPLIVYQMLKTLYQRSGYENFSFLALSASDYSRIEELIDLSFDYCRSQRIGLSLPSLRVSDIIGRLYSKLLQLKKNSLTVAVEAASSSLRDSLNKKIDLNMLFEAAKLIRTLKTRHLKVYFMYGFPNESETDLFAIGDFLRRLSESSRLKLNASINAFMPKPFSLFEGMPMQTEAVLEGKKQLIIKNLPRQTQINVSFSSIRRSIFESVISRAGREFSRVIYRAYSRGVAFDGYGEKFSWPVWEEAMKEEGIDYHFYLDQKQGSFPWSFIVKNFKRNDG